MNLSDFIDTYRTSLTQNILDTYPPLYHPGIANHDNLPQLLRQPMGAQEDAARAAALSMRQQRGTIVIGEMGTGKTFIAIAAAQLAGYQRVLVLCPPHMTNKWKREVEITVKHAHAVIIRRMDDVNKLRRIVHDGPLWVILSREQAKRGSPWRPAYAKRLPLKLDREFIAINDSDPNHAHDWHPVYHPKSTTGRQHPQLNFMECSVCAQSGELNRVLSCPRCYKQIMLGDDIPATEADLKRVKRSCHHCDEPLWQYFTRPRQRQAYPLAEYIKRTLPGWFDLLVLDEVHEYKAKGSAQGVSAAVLQSACKRTLSLSGTLMGGYSNTLFHLLYRFSPDIRQHFAHNEVSQWIDRYGFRESTARKRKENPYEVGYDGRSSRRKLYKKVVKEKPGITPNALFHLIGNTIFLRLADIAPNLPPYSERVQLFQLSEEQDDGTKQSQASQYKVVEDELGQVTKKLLASGSKRLLSTYLQTLITLPETCINGETVLWPEENHEELQAKAKQEGSVFQPIIVAVPPMNPNRIYPKEAALAKLILRERKQGRKVLVYCTHTKTRDITARLNDILAKQGLRGAILHAESTSTANREDWIQQRVNDGIDYLICHPRLVQTGLDLIDFPTICWFETDYSTYTMRQASRRSWRIGQPQPVKVYFYAYQDTLQANALQLVAQKLKASLAVEGDLTDEGLSGHSEIDDDIIMALARSIAQNDKATTGTIEAAFATAKQANVIDAEYIVDETWAQEADIFPIGADGASPIEEPAKVIASAPLPELEEVITFDWKEFAQIDRNQRKRTVPTARHQAGATLFDWAADQSTA